MSGYVAAVLPTQKRLDRAVLELARVISTLNNTLAAATMLVEETASIHRIRSDLRVSIELARLSFDVTRAARVSVHIASENAEAVIDATLIGLAIRNLLDNASPSSMEGTRSCGPIPFSDRLTLASRSRAHNQTPTHVECMGASHEVR